MNATRSTTKPTTQGSRVLSVRVTDEQFKHLVAQAHLHELTLAEATRQAIERDLDGQPDLGHEDGSPGSSMRYRSFLAVADFTAALEELQAADQD